jgi:hypothetical protein
VLQQFYPQADAAFIHAMHVTVVVSAAVAFLAALIALAWLPRKRSGAPAAQAHSGPSATEAAEAAGVA